MYEGGARIYKRGRNCGRSKGTEGIMAHYSPCRRQETDDSTVERGRNRHSVTEVGGLWLGSSAELKKGIERAEGTS